MADSGLLIRALAFWRAPAVLALFCALPVLAETHTVTVADYRFVPAVVRIKTGDSVRWVNGEKRTSHSVRLPALDGLESERFFPGEHWTLRFAKAGLYDYHCGPHPEMKGQILVED